eukprot:GHVP01025887.1.p3 GENE.GHVP01025887.1~~GHVP01025887.1.p3  ORF type:complete len:137 (-),score=12.96 GHVP01025887.1:62-472(-)
MEDHSPNHQRRYTHRRHHLHPPPTRTPIPQIPTIPYLPRSMDTFPLHITRHARHLHHHVPVSTSFGHRPPHRRRTTKSTLPPIQRLYTEIKSQPHLCSKTPVELAFTELQLPIPDDDTAKLTAHHYFNNAGEFIFE